MASPRITPKRPEPVVRSLSSPASVRPGVRGEKGPAGRAIVSVSLNAADPPHLIITYSDGTTQDAGAMPAGGGGPGGTATWADLTGKPPVIAAGADQAAARAAIGAGTSSQTLATMSTAEAAAGTATTARATTAQAIKAAVDALAPGAASWSTLPGKPAVVAAGTTQAAARSAIAAVGTGDVATVALTGSYNDLEDTPDDGFQPSLENLPAGSMVARRYVSGAYPPRGTSRTDIVVNWIGPVYPPAALDTDVWDVTP